MIRRAALVLTALSLAAGALVVAPTPASAGDPPKLMIFGDSMAKSLAKYLDANYPGYEVIDETRGACHLSKGVVLGYNRYLYGDNTACWDWTTAWPAAVARDDPDVVIVLTGGWEMPARWGESPPAECSPGPYCPKPKFLLTTPKGNERYRSKLEQAITKVGALGAEVVVVTEPYHKPPGPRPEVGPNGEPLPRYAKYVYWEPYQANPPGPTNQWPKGWRNPMKDGSTPYISGRLKTQHLVAIAHQVVTAMADPNVHIFDLGTYLNKTSDAYTKRVCPPPGPPDPSSCANPVVAREADGSHLTEAGNQIVSGPLNTFILGLL